MAKGGKRVGAGRKPKPKLEPIADRGAAARLIEQLNSLPTKDEPIEVAGWRGLWDATNASIRLDTRRYLYDQRDGKARNTVNHLHDKPIEHNVTVSYSDVIQKARKRATAHLPA